MSTEKLNAEKTKALENAMRQIEKDFGKGSIMKLGEASAKMNIEVIPTGALSLDISFGSRRHSTRQGHRDLWSGIFR
mgnify:CR=1 FL=1